MPLTTLLTNENNDIYCPDGQNLVLIQDEEALLQEVRSAGLMRLGEDIFNTLSGVDYFGTAFAAHKDLDGLRVSLINAITQFDDVISINQMTVTQSGDYVIWTASILTVYGETTVSNED